MPSLKRPDASLYYQVIGAGEPVTLLHGFTLGGASWDELISMMPAGWMWIKLDLRGHGRTVLAKGALCSMDACAGDLEALWDHLGVARSHVVGYSMGGRLALHVAVRLPERTRSLLTIGAHAGLEPEAREHRRQADADVATRIEREGVARFVDSWESLPMFGGIARRGPEFTKWLHLQRLNNGADGLAASLRGMGAGAMDPLWDELGVITVPSTFVAGAGDVPFADSARRLVKGVARGRCEVIADSGHATQFEQPDATAHVLAAHLRRAAAAASTSSATSA